MQSHRFKKSNSSSACVFFFYFFFFLRHRSKATISFAFVYLLSENVPFGILTARSSLPLFYEFIISLIKKWRKKWNCLCETKKWIKFNKCKKTRIFKKKVHLFSSNLLKNHFSHMRNQVRISKNVHLLLSEFALCCICWVSEEITHS